MTYYDATFWVGANAVIRKAALDDICVVSTEDTRTVKTYIQDRTVIERHRIQHRITGVFRLASGQLSGTVEL